MGFVLFYLKHIERKKNNQIWLNWSHTVSKVYNFSFLKTPGGEPCVMKVGCPSSRLGSRSYCLPPHAAARPSPGSSSTNTPGSSMCLNLSTTSSRPSPTPAAGCVAPWTAGPYWEHTGTSSSICTPATFTLWRTTSVLSPRTTSQVPSSAEAPATPFVPLLCAWKEGMEWLLIRLMKPGVLRSAGPWTSPWPLCHVCQGNT